MMHRFSRLLPLLAVVLSLPGAASRGQVMTIPAPTISRLRIEIDSIADLHYYVRTLATDKTGRKIPVAFERAVDAARKMDKELRHIFLAWGLVEGSLPDCLTARDFVPAFSALPETHTVREIIGRGAFMPITMKVREPAVELAEALTDIEPYFRQVVWPEHRTILRKALADIEARLLPKEPACLADIINHLGIEDPIVYLPVHLVAELPPPGAVTNAWRGGGVSYIGVKNLPPTQLFEAILHEATHTLTMIGGQSAFSRSFRKQVETLGLSRNDDGVRNAGRAILYLQSAATIRRFVDPQYRDRGETNGFYAGPGRIAVEAIRPAWSLYLDGRLTRDETVRRIAAAMEMKLLTTPPTQLMGPSPRGD